MQEKHPHLDLRCVNNAFFIQSPTYHTELVASQKSDTKEVIQLRKKVARLQHKIEDVGSHVVPFLTVAVVEQSRSRNSLPRVYEDLRTTLENMNTTNFIIQAVSEALWILERHAQQPDQLSLLSTSLLGIDSIDEFLITQHMMMLSDAGFTQISQRMEWTVVQRKKNYVNTVKIVWQLSNTYTSVTTCLHTLQLR